MSVKSIITDPKNGMQAEVVNEDEYNGLVVATRPLKVFTNRPLFFSNDEYGNDMAQDASAGGNPEYVHDGTDNTEADSGTTDGTTADKLVDSGQNFDVTVTAGMTVHNTTDDTFALVTAVDSATTLSLDTDIMVGGEAYTVGTYWTGSSIVGGKFTFDSTDQNHTTAGSKSIKTDNAKINDVMQFLKETTIDLSSYVSLTMWIYVDKDWKAGDSISISGWLTSTGMTVGIEVNLENYFDWGNFKTWQKISIPLTDMELDEDTIDALRVQIITKEGKSPKFYLDDIEFEESGTPIEYVVEPRKGTWLHVCSWNIQIADAYAGTLADGTMAKIPYHQLFSEKIQSPIVYARWDDGEITNSASILSIMDLMGFFNAKINGQGSDGTNSWVVINITPSQPIILKSEGDDKLSLTISDDLSVLNVLKVSVSCKEEDRENK